MARKYNFYPGPAVLPESVLNQALSDIWEFAGTGVGILEISHRSDEFDAVLNSAKDRARRLMNISDDYEIIFVQGGASMVMAMLSMNFIHQGDLVQYVDTGRWSRRAIKEGERQANKVGATAEVVWSGQQYDYTMLPNWDDVNIADNAHFLHITSNNTVVGTQFKTFPDTNVDIIADMSSDFFSRPIDVSKFAMIYGGIQKNLGPAGSAMVIIRKDMLDQIPFPSGLSEMLDFSVYVAKNSLYNTPAVFVIYMVEKVLAWLENDIGGLDNMANLNNEKATKLYDFIDGSGGYYYCTVPNRDDRSVMNVTFRIHDHNLESVFIDEATQAGFIGLKGHRSVGGMRASIYNAQTLQAVEELTDFMKTFMSNH